MAVLQTYQVTSNREDLSDIVTNITPHKTPLLSSLENTKALAVYHEVLQDTLSVPTANSNAQVQGVEFTAQAQHAPSRDGSSCQLFVKWPHVAGTQLAVRNAGAKNLYDYNVTQKLKELAMEMEYAIVNGTGNSGASGTGAEIKGILTCIATNTASGSGTGVTLTEAVFNDLIQSIWTQGGEPDQVYCTGTLKRAISAFTAGSTKNVEAKDKKLVAAVDVYDGDFGIQKVVAHRLLPAKAFVALQQDMWATAWLRKTVHEPLPKTGDATKGMILGELALECRNEKGSGKGVNYTN